MTAALKADHINPFISATLETFSTMIKSDAKPGKAALKSAKDPHWDISGIIGLSGGAKGSVALSFPRITALKVVSAFMGEKVVTMDDAVVDAIGELANIVAGSAKKDLSNFNISISLPTVVLGDRHELSSPRGAVPVVVPFETPLGNFALAINFKSES